MALVSDTGSSATDKITSNPAIKGTGQANTLVTIKEGGTTLGTTTADGTGAWSFTPVGLADGAHILIRHSDRSRRQYRDGDASFTLDKAPPAVSMALVSDTGSSATDKITSNPAIKGTGQASTLVTDQGGRHHARHDDGRQHGSLELHAGRPCRRRAHADRDSDRPSRQYRDGNAELHARYSRAIRGGLRAFP